MPGIKSELLESLPSSVGVYIMKGSRGEHLYIGKANNIKNRVKSYFARAGGDGRLQIPKLISTVSDIDFFVTETERDALILENSLIKRHKPTFNIQLKDDKTYASLRLSVKDRFPKLTFSRRIKDDGADYFGPFSSAIALRQIKKHVHRMFPIRDCTDVKFRRHYDRPCLNYNMKLCSGPCAGKITVADYMEIVKKASLFLKGNKKELIRMLEKNMYSASDDQRYEDAAYYRDQVEFLRKNLHVEKFMSSNLADRDIIACYRNSMEYEFVVLHSRDGQIIDKSQFGIRSIDSDLSRVLEEFIGRFYHDFRYIPAEIVIPAEIENIELHRELLSEKKGSKVNLVIPKRGNKLKLLEFALSNAIENYNRKHYLDKEIRKLLQGLKKNLKLRRLPLTVECLDISNFQGSFTVASIVSFKNAKPERDRYRKYRVKGVSGPDDYASMREVMTRRIKRLQQPGWELPDLLLVDGGRGQLSTVYDVIKECGLEGKVDVISIAKAGRNEKHDKIYTVDSDEPVSMNNELQQLYLLMRIRDEAHRFAVGYHRQLRNRESFHSILDSIPGIGKKRKSVLLSYFGSIDALRNAGIDEIAPLPAMNRKIAEVVTDYLSSLPKKNSSTDLPQ